MEATWVETDVRGWVMSDQIDEAGLARLRAAAEEELAAYVKSNGSVAFSAPAHILTATKSGR